MRKFSSTYLFPLSISLIVLLIDQASKIWIKTNMELGEEFSVLGDWFLIHFTENNGMAFGFEFAGEYGKLALSIFRIVAVSVINNGPATVESGTVTIEGVSSRGEIIQFSEVFSDLSIDEAETYDFTWSTPSVPSTINWTATVTAEGDTNENNNTATEITRVRR